MKLYTLMVGNRFLAMFTVSPLEFLHYGLVSDGRLIVRLWTRGVGMGRVVFGPPQWLGCNMEA